MDLSRRRIRCAVALYSLHVQFVAVDRKSFALCLAIQVEQVAYRGRKIGFLETPDLKGVWYPNCSKPLGGELSATGEGRPPVRLFKSAAAT
jgi:hypothetical protein